MSVGGIYFSAVFRGKNAEKCRKMQKNEKKCKKNAKKFAHIKKKYYLCTSF